MSRVSRRSGTKTKVIPGAKMGKNPKLPKYKYPPRSKYHPRKGKPASGEGN